MVAGLFFLCLSSLSSKERTHSCVADEVSDPPRTARRLLYVASPGIRDDLQYGGHGILVFAMDDGHRFVRRILTEGVGDDGRPLNIKGICANSATARLYLTTLRHLICHDLVTDRVLWEKTYESGCDRMAVAPDGSLIYLPSLEKDHWKVVDGGTGAEVGRVTTDSASHNTVYGMDGKYVYLAGRHSPLLTVADAPRKVSARTVGPFGGVVRPFTVNGRQTLCFVNVDGLLGFEIGDLATGTRLHRVEVSGWRTGAVKRHGCPSHGIGLSPDETEIWVTDSTNQRLHVFDATVMPPRQMDSVALRDEPGWVTFSIDGQFVYPSTGEVIDRRTRKILAQLTDEQGRMVQSEKLLEIDFQGNRPVQAGDQFGVGRLTSAIR
jgi:hypothetical protein